MAIVWRQSPGVSWYPSVVISRTLSTNTSTVYSETCLTSWSCRLLMWGWSFFPIPFVMVGTKIFKTLLVSNWSGAEIFQIFVSEAFNIFFQLLFFGMKCEWIVWRKVSRHFFCQMSTSLVDYDLLTKACLHFQLGLIMTSNTLHVIPACRLPWRSFLLWIVLACFLTFLLFFLFFYPLIIVNDYSLFLLNQRLVDQDNKWIKKCNS